MSISKLDVIAACGRKFWELQENSGDLVAQIAFGATEEYKYGE